MKDITYYANDAIGAVTRIRAGAFCLRNSVCCHYTITAKLTETIECFVEVRQVSLVPV